MDITRIQVKDPLSESFEGQVCISIWRFADFEEKYDAQAIYYVACQWHLGQEAVIKTCGFQSFLGLILVNKRL